MNQEIVETFIEALRALEEEGEVEPIVGLFASDCTVGNVTIGGPFHGVDGARDFWTRYKSTLGEPHSEFKNKISSGNSAALEWTTEGTTPSGGNYSYDGVSILEAEGSKITRFYAYFNPGDLGEQIGGQSVGAKA